MIPFRRVAIVLVCLSAFSAQGPPASTQESTAKIWVGRYQEIEEYLRTGECVSMQGSASQSGALHPSARRARRPDGLEIAAAGGAPRILGELQNRNRRVRARQALEDGHGAADRRAATRRQ